MYLISLRLDGIVREIVTIRAESVDTNRIPFVTIKGIKPEFESALLVSSADNKLFEDTAEVELPYTQVILIRKLRKGHGGKLKVLTSNNKDGENGEG